MVAMPIWAHVRQYRQFQQRFFLPLCLSHAHLTPTGILCLYMMTSCSDRLILFVFPVLCPTQEFSLVTSEGLQNLDLIGAQVF
jgi:hypothetical protein